MPRTTKRTAPRVGSRVKLKFGGREVVGVVVEERGPVGVGGRSLLRVHVDVSGSSDGIELELPAQELKPTPTRRVRRVKSTRHVAA